MIGITINLNSIKLVFCFIKKKKKKIDEKKLSTHPMEKQISLVARIHFWSTAEINKIPPKYDRDLELHFQLLISPIAFNFISVPYPLVAVTREEKSTPIETPNFPPNPVIFRCSRRTSAAAEDGKVGVWDREAPATISPAKIARQDAPVAG